MVLESAFSLLGTVVLDDGVVLATVVLDASADWVVLDPAFSLLSEGVKDADGTLDAPADCPVLDSAFSLPADVVVDAVGMKGVTGLLDATVGPPVVGATVVLELVVDSSTALMLTVVLLAVLVPSSFTFLSSKKLDVVVLNASVVLTALSALWG